MCWLSIPDYYTPYGDPNNVDDWWDGEDDDGDDDEGGR